MVGGTHCVADLGMVDVRSCMTRVDSRRPVVVHFVLLASIFACGQNVPNPTIGS